MEFKIDTKSSYIHITPVSEVLNANLTAALRQKSDELTENDNQNFIIDMANCKQADTSAFPQLIQWHEQCYDNSCSLVFTNLSEELMKVFKDNDEDLYLNLAPTMQEAVDMISMEILERDLLNEE